MKSLSISLLIALISLISVHAKAKSFEPEVGKTKYLTPIHAACSYKALVSVNFSSLSCIYEYRLEFDSSVHSYNHFVDLICEEDNLCTLFAYEKSGKKTFKKHLFTEGVFEGYVIENEGDSLDSVNSWSVGRFISNNGEVIENVKSVNIDEGRYKEHVRIVQIVDEYKRSVNLGGKEYRFKVISHDKKPIKQKQYFFHNNKKIPHLENSYFFKTIEFMGKLIPIDIISYTTTGNVLFLSIKDGFRFNLELTCGGSRVLLRTNGLSNSLKFFYNKKSDLKYLEIQGADFTNKKVSCSNQRYYSVNQSITFYPSKEIKSLYLLTRLYFSKTVYFNFSREIN